MSALTTLQSDFQDYVLGSAGERPAIVGAVREQFGLKADARLAIYHNAYRIRLREALSASYDKTWSYIGDDMFAALADSYIAAHPSHHPNLRWFGGDFAAHAARELADHPFIAELAQFEWALGLAFDAPDAAAVSAAGLADIAPEAWGALVFGLHPSVRLLALEWNVVALWQALGQDQGPPDVEQAAAPQTWMVWRTADQPHFRSLPAAEAQALHRIGAGATFGDVCEAAGDEAAALAMAGYLQHWLAQGVLTAPR
ncbi:DUF2063 domain-containing protein [Rugamonas sp.]|uniref:HvfC/BufC N-terminal domain-containing protein n=1 Tax=Rugamonas sp. TaxID=1926287 RepID=UPI0025DCA2F2|nr:DNA-binding domain-containing protein [Rugamonas sp.]